MTVQLAKSCAIYLGGQSTAFVSEAMSDVGGGTRLLYQIADANKVEFDPGVAITVYDDASPVTSTDYAVDYVQGLVTFSVARAAGHTITISGSYRPVVQVAQANSVELEYGYESADISHFGDAAPRKTPSLKLLKGSFSTLDSIRDDLEAGGGSTVIQSLLAAPFFIQVSNGLDVLRAWVVADPVKTQPKQGPEAIAWTVPFTGIVQACVGRPSTDQAMWKWSTT